ncbi:Teichuronic acid biosynthesis protein TuaB [termite gut metagenome]|uniref:Teichuronic acid biosynthesis protein TuaB n=1 Tax=termite gut metagenome TaxID=433724 RepID=A0A5J4R6A5_9ZZZZ
MTIKQEVIRGSFYTAVSKYAGIIVSLVISAVLARLLTPEDFGIVAVATVIISFFGIFSDLGIGPAIIQHQALSKEDLSYIYSFTIYSGFVIGILFFVSSWLIAEYYQNNKLVSVCQILSLNVFFATINIVPNALLLKNKRFKFIAYRSFIFQITGGIISVIAVLCGAGMYALLINPVFSSIGIFVTNFIQYPQKFYCKLEVKSLKHISSFSTYQFLFSFVNYFSRNLDKLMVGKYLGMISLGFYEKSYRLMMLPLANITHVITPVIHPLFAQYQNDLKRLTAYDLKIIRFFAFIGFPLAILLFFTSKELILLVFGEQWVAAVSIFKILSLSVGLQIIYSASGSMFQSANAVKEQFHFGILAAAINVLGLLIALFIFKSSVAVAWGVVITFTLNFLQCYWFLFCKVLKSRLSLFFRELYSPLIISVIIALVLYCVTIWSMDMLLIYSLGLKVMVFFLLLFLYVQITGEYDVIGRIKLVILGR